MTTHLKKKLILQPKHKSPLFSSILLSKTNLPSTHNKQPTFKKSKPSKLKATSQSPIKLNSSTPYTKDKIKEKTLVIDLDETLVHSDFTFFYNPDVILKVGIDDDDPNTKCDVYVSIRPGVKEFLYQLSSYYEIVFFTASCESYAKPIMNYIDEKKVVSHKFFRKNCTEQEGVYIKDLTKLEKDLRNVVLLDNNIYSYAFQRENGIPIRSWYGDYNDIELFKLIPLLKNLSGFYDVRTEIPKFVMNNTFIWMKGINWLKEHLLNTTYYVEVENVMQMERRNCSLSQESIRSNNNNNILTVEGGLTPMHKNSYDNRSDSSSGSNNVNNISNNNNNTTTKVLNGRTVLRTKTQSSSASKEKDNNDCIKITNNFFYDSSANIKIIDNNDDGGGSGGVSSSNKEKQLYNINTNNNNNSNDTDTDLSKEDTAVAYTGLVTEFKHIDDDKHTRPLRKSSSSSKKNKCNNNSTGGNLTNTNFTSGYHNLRKHPVIKQTHKQSIKKTFYNNSKHSLYKIFKKTISKEKNNNSFVNVSKEDIGTLCQLNMSTGSTHEHINNEHHSLIKIIKLKKSTHHLPSYSITPFNSTSSTSKNPK